MGRSEWGFLIKTKEDLDHVLELVDEHNSRDDLGEELELTCIFKYRNKLYLCIGNGGGRSFTSEFIDKKYKGELCYHPFDKPKWWMNLDKQQIMWKADSKTPPETIFKK
jgi:hypothetical protein